MRFPVKSSERLTSEGIVRKVTRYLERLAPGGESAEEDETLDKDLVAGSEAMVETWDRIRRAGRTNEIVLLRGESGTGKSFIARKLHELSERRDKPFVEVAMTADVGSDNLIQSDLFGHEKGAFTGADAQKDGLFSLADGGTIFLDEIGDASEELQARLLRVIEARTFKRLGGVKDITVDVRIIAATNRDLEKMVEEGTFRRDLYYRLSVIPIELPPLRERPEDIPALVDFLLQRIASGGRTREVGLADGLIDDLRSYPWPGNIRELDHALRHAVTMCEGAEITRDDLPASICAFLEGRGRTGASVLPGPEAGDSVVNVEALRRAIRSSDPVASGTSGSPHDIPAHLEHAKRAYLEVLIEEFNGDLGLIARFWDRSSEKTILKLIRDCGLEEKLKEARDEGRKSK